MYPKPELSGMNREGDQREEFLSKLTLDMKALALLCPSDFELRSVVQRGLADTHDEQVHRVLDSLTAAKTEKKDNGLALAVGQLILGSFLMVAGVSAIAPLLMGATSPGAIASFFSNALSTASASPVFFPALPELVVVLSMALLLSALYSLRRASVTLKDAGYTAR